MPATPNVELQELAQSFGIQLEYRSMSGELQAASTESLLAILKVLGAEITTEDDAPKALREHRLARIQRGIEPVVVLWEEEGDGSVEVRIASTPGQVEIQCRLAMDQNFESIYRLCCPRAITALRWNALSSRFRHPR
jgi:hypothetical protein